MHGHTHTHSKAHLAPYLPTHPITPQDGVTSDKSFGTVSAAMWGSASILPISWAYVKLMGPEGLKSASEVCCVCERHCVLCVCERASFSKSIFQSSKLLFN